MGAAVSHLYVMEAAGHLKLGRAIDPAARRTELQTGNPAPVRLVRTWRVPGDLVQRLEADVHRRARWRSRRRAVGEWFEGLAIDDAIAIIDEVVAPYRDVDPERISQLSARCRAAAADLAELEDAQVVRQHRLRHCIEEFYASQAAVTAARATLLRHVNEMAACWNDEDLPNAVREWRATAEGKTRFMGHEVTKPSAEYATAREVSLSLPLELQSAIRENGLEQLVAQVVAATVELTFGRDAA